MSVTDREKASLQISSSDFLIWLVDIENGGITQDDIQFMEGLSIKTAFLIVFTKADTKTEAQIQEILNTSRVTLTNSNISFYGITAYSSKEGKEYQQTLIPQFLSDAIASNVRTHDIFQEFIKSQNDLRHQIKMKFKSTNNSANQLFQYIRKSDNVLEITSATKRWGEFNQESYKLSTLLTDYDNIVSEMNPKIKSLCEKE